MKQVIGILLLLAVGHAARAQFPERPVEIVMPTGPGGATDTITRLLADKWRECLGQPVVVVNKPGAAGAVGARFVAEAKPDGYTLLATFESNIVLQPMIRKDVGYDLRSFRYLGGYGRVPVFYTVNSKSPWKSIPEFIAEARRNPGKLSFGTFGTGSVMHLAGERLWELAGVRLVHVPFKSGPESAAALIGGHIDIAVTPGTSGLAGNASARMIGVASEARWPSLSEIPTLAEQGYPVFIETLSGLAAPRDLPEPVRRTLVESLNACVQKYADQLREPFLRRETILVQVSGEETARIYQQREALFKELALKLNLAEK